MKNYGIILASGTGSRCQNNIPKQFIKIGNRTILEHTIDIFEKNQEIDDIIVVIAPEYKSLAEKILRENNYKKITKLLNGGETRKESSYIGIHSIEDNDANVLIHDCARPFITQKIILDCIDSLKKYDAAVVAIPSTDTILEVENNIIKNVPKRVNLKLAQTPQCFKLSLIKRAHELAKGNQDFTDDCGLVIKYNLADIHIIEGSTENIKITYPNDIYLAERILELRKNNDNIE